MAHVIKYFWLEIILLTRFIRTVAQLTVKLPDSAILKLYRSLPVVFFVT